MITVETVAEVTTTCYLTEEDEETVKNYMKENCCDLKDAVKELFWNNEIDIYLQSTESDFSTNEITRVMEEKDDEKMDY